MRTESQGTNYYSFGMQMPGRSYVGPTGYRYGFNGMEKDDEVKGSSGTSYDYGFRIYDPRLGRFLSVDPLQAKYPNLSPYLAFENNPVFFNDPTGLDAKGKVTGNTITISATIYIIGAGATAQKAGDMQKNIMSVWASPNTPKTYTDKAGKVYNVKFDVQVKILDPSGNNPVDAGTNVVNLVDASKVSDKSTLMSNGKFRSYNSGATGISGKWDNTSDAQTESHETGHFFGLADAYYDYEIAENNLTLGAGIAGKKGSENFPTTQATNPLTIMGAAAGSGNGKVTQMEINGLAEYVLKNQDKNGDVVIPGTANINPPPIADIIQVESESKIITTGERK